MTYSEALHYLLSTFATTDVKNEGGNLVCRLRQHSFSIKEYANELTERALKCGEVFEDNELMGVFVEGVTYEIRRNIQHY